MTTQWLAVWFDGENMVTTEFKPEDFMSDESVGMPYAVPPQLPATILDMERAEGSFDMMLTMADACPGCGSVGAMRVGDRACWGQCYACFSSLMTLIVE